MDPFPVWSGYGPAPSDCRRYLRASPGAFPSGIQEIGFDRANDEIGRLPEELLSAVLAKTTARDASRAAAVSQPFRAAADSDAVWTCFVPALTDEELEAPAPRSKKELFFLLLERPVLLQDGLMGDTRQMLYAIGEEAVHRVRRHAAALELDPSLRLQVLPRGSTYPGYLVRNPGTNTQDHALPKLDVCGLPRV